MLTAARPRQWAKNVLVFAAPVTGGLALQPWALGRALLTFVAFCLVSSGLYYVNDLIDRPLDQAHPTKRHRPIAAGRVPPTVAAVAAGLLIVTGLALALVVSSSVALVATAYVALTLLYTVQLRSVVLFDLAAIAGGFILRAVAGGVAVGVTFSSWFLIVASFGALFIAAGKRHAEHIQMGDKRGDSRATLAVYSESYLRFIQYTASTVAIAAYCLWAFEGITGSEFWNGLSIIPFVLGILRYGLLLETGRGGSPEELILRDRTLLGTGVVWVLLVGISVYVG